MRFTLMFAPWGVFAKSSTTCSSHFSFSDPYATPMVTGFSGAGVGAEPPDAAGVGALPDPLVAFGTASLPWP